MISHNSKNISILDPPGIISVTSKLFLRTDVMRGFGLDYEKEIKRELAMKILHQLESEGLIEYRSVNNPAQDGIEMHARIKVLSPYPTLNIMI